MNINDEFDPIIDETITLKSSELNEILKGMHRFAKSPKIADNKAMDDFNEHIKKFGLEFGLGIINKETGQLDTYIRKIRPAAIFRKAEF